MAWFAPQFAYVQDAAAAALPADGGSVLSSLRNMTSSVPSLRSLSKLALGGAQVLLGSGSTAQAQNGTAATCPANGQISCQNTTVVENLCCFNAPGGQLLQTQFWDTDPVTGPDDSWTIHGLWYESL